MKNFYWGDHGLLLLKRFSHLLKSKNNRSRTLFSFALPLLFFLFSNQASAQEPRQDSGADGSAIRPLRLGEKIPEHIWQQELQMHYFDGSTKTIRLSDLKGKVLLFDFWSTGCPSCIGGFPKMEDYQKKYADDLVIILVNSNRNKDTPARIANRFKVYKEVYGYTPVLPSVLDDTLFTTLFPHNSLPNNTFINKDGEYLVSCMGGIFSEKQLQKVITTGTTDIIHNGVFLNQGKRNNVPPLIDTTGVDFLRAFLSYQPQYLAADLGLTHKNNHSFFQRVNNNFLHFCNQAFRTELKGFHIHEYVFEDQIARDIIDRILLKRRSTELYSYQLFTKDSINQDKALELLREDFLQKFNIGIKRQTSELDVYSLELTDKLLTIKTKGGMKRSSFDFEGEQMLTSNISVSIILTKLIYWLDRPIDSGNLSPEELSIKVDVEIPADFSNYSTPEQLKYLEGLGLKLTPKRVTKEYPLFYSTSGKQTASK